MITAVSQQGHPSVALARQRVVLATKAELSLPGVGGEQRGRVIHRACEHAEFILEHSARRQERPLEFHTLLRSQRQSCGTQRVVRREPEYTLQGLGADATRRFVAWISQYDTPYARRKLGITTPRSG